MKSSEEINEIAGAMALAQAAIKNPTKAKLNPHFKAKYADLSAGLDCMRSALSAQGIAIFQATEIVQDSVVLLTRLVHKSGQWVGCCFPVSKFAPPQQMGSALTYARRQSLFALVGIAGEDDDDDGNHTNGENGAPEPDLPASARAFIDRAKKTIGEFRDGEALRDWWASDAQKAIRDSVGVVNTKTGPRPGYKELWDAFSAKGRELSGT